MKEKIRQFMIGRYGTDGLNQFLNIASLVLILVYIPVSYTHLTLPTNREV